MSASERGTYFDEVTPAGAEDRVLLLARHGTALETKASVDCDCLDVQKSESQRLSGRTKIASGV